MASQPKRKILFVCEHGALRCRLAAAYFNAEAPEGWEAVTAGVTPQAEVSPKLLPLLEGTAAHDFADTSAPHELSSAQGERMITIDASIAGDESWTTDGSDQEMREQIRNHVTGLVRDLAD
ncbi:MAG TPA: hypothetical protein VM284_05130 [Candidatus Limnocylindria bacterium]|nr:hypothetical protein [Candidatus Limnocylindria bacterium]